MRIVLLSDRIPPQASGAGNAAWSLAVGLRKLDHEVHVVTAASEATTREEREGIPVTAIKAHVPDRWRAYLSLYNPLAVREFSRCIDRIRPNIIHAHNVHADLSYGCLWLAHRKGYSVVWTAHDVMSVAYGKLTHYVDPAHCPENSASSYRLPVGHNLQQARFRFNPLRNIFIHHIMRHHVRARLAVSDVLRLALEANGLPPCEVIHTCVHVDRFQADPARVEKLRQRLDLGNRPTLLFAGRIGAAKGSQQALAALAAAAERVPQIALLVLSDRPLDMGKHAHLRGKHVYEGGWLSGEDLAAAYGLASAVICPSICLDSFSLVALEAMAARKPLIASCHGGFQEIVVHGETGFIVNPFDTADFAGRIAQILLDPALGEGMGQAGYRRCRASFTAEQYAQRMLEVYEGIRA